MFRRTAYESVNETKRRKEEREQLTGQFHRSLKILQQKEHIDGTTIISNEASNNLCSVLEAVFLHGVKDNMMSKLVSYAHGTSTEVKLNFWSVMKKFTHKDVLVQLNELSQINSDIGLCRAWVRLAINDGLMASYLASLKADTKAMQSFYHTWAYLLDFEQPDILHNHLTGLMGLNFHLSLNSSVLNTWSSMTITLAGLAVDTPALHPVIPSDTPTPPSSQRHSQTSVTSADTDGTAAKVRAASDVATTVTTTAIATISVSPAVATCCPRLEGVISTPPNTPADPSFFTHAHDADILKRFGAGFLSSSVSSGSSGQASCPDPGEPFSARSSRSNSPHASPYESLRYMSREDRKMDEEMKLKALLQHLDQREWEREQEEEDRKKKEEKERAQKEEREQRKKAVAMAREEKKESERRRREEGEQASEAAANARQATHAPHASNGTNTLRENLGRSRLEGDEDGHRPLNRVEQGGGEGGQGLTSHMSSFEESIETVSSVAEAESPDQERSDHVDSASTNLVTPHTPRGEEEEEDWKERNQSSLGNSLNAMDGWTSTSPYYHPSPSQQHPSHPHPHQHQNHNLLHQQKSTFDQSYETMLKGYQAGQGSESGIVPIKKVLDNLPDSGQSSSQTGQTARDRPSEPFTAVDMMWPVYLQSDEEIDFTDYEIISTPEETSDTVKLEQMKSLCRIMGKNSQSNMCATPSCNMGVGFFHGAGHICNFDGLTYCEQCHLSQTTYIPAEIVFNWNFKKKKVCAENYKFLQRVQDQPLLDMEELSPCIYSTVPAINTIMQLRVQLTSLRSYMFMCSESTASQLKDRVWPREHLYHKVHLYSLTDLVEVRSGRLEVFLKEIVELCTRHVSSCTLCQAKGFYCELCQDPSPIFPFQVNSTVKCKNCKNVYHLRCKTESIACPKCVRYAQRGVRRQTGDDDDYACSPDV